MFPSDPTEATAPTSASEDFDRVLADTIGSEALAVCVLKGLVIVYTNPGSRSLFGEPIEHGVTLLPDLALTEDREWLRERLENLFSQKKESLSLTFRAQGPQGSAVDIEMHVVPTLVSDSSHVLAFLFDITEQRRQEEQLNFLAFLDPLTGLPNRAMFLDRCREILMSARQDNSGFALLQCDLDGFKAVNDTHGHAAGDMLLKVVAERLAGCLRRRDVVARQGGDEFALLLPDVGSNGLAQQLAERLIREVSAPIPLGDFSVKVGISIGIALYPEHGRDIDTLLNLADRAMYASKEAGRNRYTVAEKLTDAAPLIVELLAWNQTHAVGIEVIDRQHRGLMDLVNRLGNELKNGLARERLQETVQELLTATEIHFQTEEDLMSEHDIKSLETHRGKHQQLLADVRRFGVEVDRRSMALTMRYLQEWLIRHIETMDKGLGRLLQDRGVH
ncbi:MAG: diguanylate cyclase [Methylococcus sp.]|nr:MAG: diguanylate cyclase [Methylococcus sp.]